MDQFVYFIGRKNSDDGPIKIGITYNIPMRLRSLQTSAPYELECHDFFQKLPEGMAPRVEAHLHSMLRERRIKGEWFNIGKHEIPAIAAQAFAELELGEPDFFDHAELPNPQRPPLSEPEMEQVTLNIEARLLDLVRDDWPNWERKLNRILDAHFFG